MTKHFRAYKCIFGSIIYSLCHLYISVDRFNTIQSLSGAVNIVCSSRWENFVLSFTEYVRNLYTTDTSFINIRQPKRLKKRSFIRLKNTCTSNISRLKYTNLKHTLTSKMEKVISQRISKSIHWSQCGNACLIVQDKKLRYLNCTVYNHDIGDQPVITKDQ